jgi:excisionase family DNA binding protein
MNAAALPELLRPEEVAKVLGCSKPFIYALAKRGELPCVVMGRAVRFDPSDVAAFIAERRGTRHHTEAAR